MIRRFFEQIRPYIRSETTAFFKFILPRGILLTLVFMIYAIEYDNILLWKKFLFGFLCSVGGLYLMRIVAWLVKKVIIRKSKVIPDIYDSRVNTNT